MKDKILYILLFICLCSFGQGKKKLIASYQQANVAPALDVIIRVNMGGSAITATDGEINWEAGTSTTGTSYSVSGGATNTTPSTYTWTRHASIPSSIPDADFQTLYDSARQTGVTQTYTIPVANGTYTLNLFLGEINTTGNPTLIDITLEGVLEYDDFNPSVAYGFRTAGMLQHEVTVADGNITMEITKASVGGTSNVYVYGFQILE